MTPEARAARERKQKIFVVVGGLFLVALLAIQLPKLLGGSSSSTAPTTTTDTSAAVEAGSAGTPVALTEATPTAAPATAKLTSFTVFARKDPFVQQVATEVGQTPSSTSEGSKGSEQGEKSGTTGTSKAFSTGGSTAAAVTIVTVNGARQVLQPGMKFPAGDPVFVLLAENPGSKSVVVGIAGGAFTGGRKTATVKVGDPLRLVNTTTGARYKISLVSVGTGGPAQQPEHPPSQP